jgi:hypothetical protein
MIDADRVIDALDERAEDVALITRGNRPSNRTTSVALDELGHRSTTGARRSIGQGMDSLCGRRRATLGQEVPDG